MVMLANCGIRQAYTDAYIHRIDAAELRGQSQAASVKIVPSYLDVQ